MKSIHRFLALTSLMISLTVSTVVAQANSRVLIDIPFEFTVGTKTLPAGEYMIEPNRRDSDTVWVLKSTRGNDVASLITLPKRANKTPNKATLVFRRYDEMYFLSQIWTPGENTGRELRMSDREKILQLAAVEFREEYVVVGGHE